MASKKKPASPCTCSAANPRVLQYRRVHWQNGTTDVQLRRLGSQRSGYYYRVIEHCCEHITRDGTGISNVYSVYRQAHRAMDFYADMLLEKPARAMSVTQQT